MVKPVAQMKTSCFEYQETRRFFAQVGRGLETIASGELEALGAQGIEPAVGGFHFCADTPTFYAIHYRSRLLTRILAPLLTFACSDRDDLYRAGRSLDWTAVLSIDLTFSVAAHVSDNRNLRHSKFAALCLKDAVADFFTDRFGKRPNVDRSNPDARLNLYIEKEKAVISLDTSGGSLHRRGYRGETVEAPLQETLAAGMVALAGWNGETPLYDPMCGSGTLLCEALMVSCRIPAGLLRKSFGFCRLPDFDRMLWERVRKEADGQIRPLPLGRIAGSDKDGAALRAARSNCSLLPGGDMIRLSRKDFRQIGGIENRVILCNPPYGVRLAGGEDLGALYKDLGDFLKHRCKGSQAYVYFGNREMMKKIGLRAAWKKPLRNAGLDGRLVRYDLY